MAEQWSTETEDALAAEFVQQFLRVEFNRVDGERAARLALTFLAEAGALLPTGGRQGSGDWRIVYGLGETVVWAERLTAKGAEHCLADARHAWPSARKQCRATTSWPDGSVYYGPWREVPE